MQRLFHCSRESYKTQMHSLPFFLFYHNKLSTSALLPLGLLEPQMTGEHTLYTQRDKHALTPPTPLWDQVQRAGSSVQMHITDPPPLLPPKKEFKKPDARDSPQLRVVSSLSG